MKVILLILLIVSWAALYFYRKRQLSLIAKLELTVEKKMAKEEKIFAFLHSLGESFSESARLTDLHKIIVENALAILGAHGGVVYLSNEKSTALVPRYVSPECPPLMPIPQNILNQMARGSNTTLLSFVRLHAIASGEGLIGSAWETREAILLEWGDNRLAALRANDEQTTSAMICPLIYGSHRLGVLAVGNGALDDPFTISDLALFKAIAEQAAFALFSAQVYSDASEKKQMDRDLRIAEEIQRILLPSTAPELRLFEICGVNIPASQVSGDYFDLNIQVDSERHGVAIADVSGKGVPASLVMAMCRAVLRTKAKEGVSPASVLREVNHLLYPDIKEDMFISMAYVVLNDQDANVTLCRAGHDAPLLYSAKDQQVTKVNPPGMALGIDSGDVFNRITCDFPVVMESGDCLILYTDGVTEALDNAGMEFGMIRMIQSIQASAVSGASGVIERLTDDLHDFVQEFPQNDDITLIVIRKK